MIHHDQLHVSWKHYNSKPRRKKTTEYMYSCICSDFQHKNQRHPNLQSFYTSWLSLTNMLWFNITLSKIWHFHLFYLYYNTCTCIQCTCITKHQNKGTLYQIVSREELNHNKHSCKFALNLVNESRQSNSLCLMTSKSAVTVGSEDDAFLDGLLSKNSLMTW